MLSATVFLRRDEMSLHGVLREVIFGENLEMKMVWVQQRGLIASQKTCRKCDSDMRFGTKSGVTVDSCGAASAKVVKQLFLPETKNNFKIIDKSRHNKTLIIAIISRINSN